MEWTKPSRAEVAVAMGIYLAVAYADAAPPKMVRTKLDSLNAVADDAFYAHAAFEADKIEQPPTRYSLRLGNRTYPHMKLVIERTPTGSGHLYRADTHDQHVRPQPGTRDAELFGTLLVANQRVSEQIELAWEQAGLPTFKAYLKQDLARRMASARAAADQS